MQQNLSWEAYSCWSDPEGTLSEPCRIDRRLSNSIFWKFHNPFLPAHEVWQPRWCLSTEAASYKMPQSLLSHRESNARHSVTAVRRTATTACCLVGRYNAVLLNYVRTVTSGWTAEESGFDSWQGQDIFPIIKPALELTLPRIQWIKVAPYSELKWPGREAAHPSQSIAKVKDVSSHTSTPP
jgi:hypothetical protein